MRQPINLTPEALASATTETCKACGHDTFIPILEVYDNTDDSTTRLVSSAFLCTHCQAVHRLEEVTGPYEIHKCECGSTTFQQGLRLKKISKLMIGTTGDVMTPASIILCRTCNKELSK